MPSRSISRLWSCSAVSSTGGATFGSSPAAPAAARRTVIGPARTQGRRSPRRHTARSRDMRSSSRRKRQAARMIARVRPARASTLSAAEITPLIRPPLDVSMNGYPPLKKRSPMWITSALTKWMITSPSVWAGSRGRHDSSRSVKVTASAKVTTGNAPSGDGGIFLPKVPMNCSVLIRRLTFSCATRSAPARPRFSLPSTWSPCQWVLTTIRTGSGVIAFTAARIFTLSWPYRPSIRKAPLLPTERPRLPPAPVSM